MTTEFEEYLASFPLPECDSSEKREKLRGELMDGLRSRRETIARRRSWLVACVAILAICTGSLLVASPSFREYVFLRARLGSDGLVTYLFARTSGTPDTVEVGSRDPDFVIDIEQTRKDLTEFDWLRRQGDREVVKVWDTELDGQVGRIYFFRYVLSDGREVIRPEVNPEVAFPQKVSELDQFRLTQLWIL